MQDEELEAYLVEHHVYENCKRDTSHKLNVIC